MVSTVLNITEVSASQSQKEVTINEAIDALALATNQVITKEIDNTNALFIDSIDTGLTATSFEFERNFVFRLTEATTAPTAPIIVRVKEVPRFFAMENQTTFQVTVRVDVANDGTADGTEVVIPAASAFLLYSDGTNIVSVGGGGGGLDIQEDGVEIADTDTLNFRGLVNLTDQGGGVVDVEIESGGLASFIAGVSSETVDLVVETRATAFRAPLAFDIAEVRASLTEPSTSGQVSVDILVNSVSILSTPLTIDANETTSATAAVAAVLSSTSIADDDEISFDVTAAGTAARGLNVAIIPVGVGVGGFTLAVNDQTGTTYTPNLLDANDFIRLDNAGAITVTIPAAASVDYAIGTQLKFEQVGAGAVTLAPDTGVTLNSRGSLLTTNGQFAVARCVKVAADTWTVFGDLA